MPKTLSEKYGGTLTKSGFKLYTGHKENDRSEIYLYERISWNNNPKIDIAFFYHHFSIDSNFPTLLIQRFN